MTEQFIPITPEAMKNNAYFFAISIDEATKILKDESRHTGNYLICSFQPEKNSWKGTVENGSGTVSLLVKDKDNILEYKVKILRSKKSQYKFCLDGENDKYTFMEGILDKIGTEKNIHVTNNEDSILVLVRKSIEINPIQSSNYNNSSAFYGPKQSDNRASETVKEDPKESNKRRCCVLV